MNASDVEIALNAVELREKVILHLAVFSGLRPGEILAHQRCNVAADGSSIGIEQRVYRGDLDAPKDGKTRVVAAAGSRHARGAVGGCGKLRANGLGLRIGKPRDELWRDNLLRRHIRPALEK